MIGGLLYIFFAVFAGTGFWLGLLMLVRRVRARRRLDLEAEPQRTALIALHYRDDSEPRPADYPTPGIPFLAIFALLMLRPGLASWEYYLWVCFALWFLPGTWLELREYSRELTVGPAIAARHDGLHLARWRGSAFLPWAEVAFLYTDPSDAGGYVADESPVTLHVKSASGRSWRYSSRDFPPGAPAEFARLVAFATLRTAPPGSMLTNGRL